MSPENYLFTPEFLTLTTLSLLSAATPGADFALVVRNSVLYSRKIAFYTVLGIGCGILFHLTYILLGFGFMIASSITLLNLLKYIGASYLLYLGIKSLINPRLLPNSKNSKEADQLTSRASIKMGFFNNILNIQSVILLLSLFAVVINPNTPFFVQLGYGLWRILVSVGWFSMVILFFTHPAIKERVLALGLWFKIGTGIVLCLLSVRVFLSDPTAMCLDIGF